MAVAFPRWKFVADLSVENPVGIEQFQVKTIIYWRPGMAGDFRDIRFATRTGKKLPYWIESKTNFVNATVWIALPANDKKIRMYYGNGVVNNESDEYSVFDFYNDGSTLSNFSTTTGSPTISGNAIYFNAGDEIYYEFGSSFGMVLEWKSKSSNVNERYFNAQVFSENGISPPSNSLAMINFGRGSNTIDYYSGGYTQIGSYVANTYNEYKIEIPTGANKYNCYKDGSLLQSDIPYRNNDGSPSSIGFLCSSSNPNPSYIDWIRVRKYAATEPTLSIIRNRINQEYATTYIETGSADIISASTTTEVIGRGLLDKITAGDVTQVSGDITKFVEGIQAHSTLEVISNDDYIDKIEVNTTCVVNANIDSIKVFADIDNHGVENVRVSKSINDAMWQLTANFDGTDSPAEFRHLDFSRADRDGVTRHLFTGIIPDTRYTLQIAQNKIAVTAFDYGWYLSAQFVPSSMLVMNIDGDYSSWDKWIEALLDETGITAYKLTICTKVPEKEFVFDEKTTKQQAIDEIAKATGFIFSVQWAQVGNTYEPAAYFIDPDYIDDTSNGLDLPDAATITWPDKSLVSIPTLQSPTDEKINRVKVRGCDNDGNWYYATIETSAVMNREDKPREYSYESGDLDTQTKVNTRAASLFAYFTSDSYTVEATFIKRFDLQLFQKIRFTGSDFPAKLTDLGWLRIISIEYSAANANELVTIKAVVNRDVSLIMSEINTYLQDGVSEDEILINSKLSSLNTTPLIGTVQSISGNTATILTEDGKTIKARIIS